MAVYFGSTPVKINSGYIAGGSGEILDQFTYNITENGTTTLATAGKYCDRNIDVNVDVAGVSLTDFVQGTMQGEYIDANVTSLRFGAFAGCGNITKVSLPNCTKINGNYTFFASPNLEEISLPNVTSGTFSSTFRKSPKLKIIDLRSLGGAAFQNHCFGYCPSLETLIFGGTEINTIIDTSVLYKTPETMSIYVPDNLVDAYKAATNWATFASRIKSRNDYPGGAI